MIYDVMSILASIFLQQETHLQNAVNLLRDLFLQMGQISKLTRFVI
jgi:hypothetical protein